MVMINVRLLLLVNFLRGKVTKLFPFGKLKREKFAHSMQIFLCRGEWRFKGLGGLGPESEVRAVEVGTTKEVGCRHAAFSCQL